MNVYCLNRQNIYIKVELGSLINETIKEKIDSGEDLDMIDNSGDENPYRELIVNNASKIQNTLSQMEQCSILSNVTNYVQHSKNPKDFHAMTIRPLNNIKANKAMKAKDKDDLSLRIGLVFFSDRSREEYLDRYQGVTSEILNTTRFDKNTDFSITYLGRLSMT